MKRPLILFLLLLILLGAFPIFSSANDMAVTLMSDDEWAYLRLLNDERLEKGVLPLSTFDALKNASDMRSLELGKQFSHTRPNGTFWESVLDENNIKYNGQVETNSSVEKDYKKVFANFKNSNEQYKNLTRDFFRHSSESFNSDAENILKVTFNNILIGGCEFERVYLLGYDGNRMNITIGESLSDEKYILACKCSHGVSYMPVSEKMLTMDTNKVGRQTAVIKYGNLNAKVNLYVDFADVNPKAWYYGYVRKAYDKELFSGTSATEFSPDVQLSRAMFVTVLARVVDFDPSICGYSTFNDVPKNSWYSSAVAWAYDQGIVSGVGNNEFHPEDPVTREQICLMLKKFAEKIKVELPVNTEEKVFKDNDKISSWAADAVSACQKAGIVGGDANDNFNPSSGATRAQAALMLVKFSEIVGDN